ncbi:MAG: hypothetical protein M3405_12645 [Acidobacteriota bacterium]|jgi:hypothetical protein|nr:hypothetical protein [Acidobacteriota bacterium]
MLLPQYDLKADASLTVFEFVSVGNKGEIVKIIQFLQISDNLYNLGFGDKNIETGEISDIIISNNGDSQKVLATVAASIDAFMTKYPNASVYATGSTKARTRLYRIGITNNLDEILIDFEIFGLSQGEFEKFKKSVDYQGFLIKRRG